MLDPVRGEAIGTEDRCKDCRNLEPETDEEIPKRD